MDLNTSSFQGGTKIVASCWLCLSRAHAEVWEQACLWKPKPENVEYLELFLSPCASLFPSFKNRPHFFPWKIQAKKLYCICSKYLQHCCVSLLKQRQQKKLCFVLLPSCLTPAGSTSVLWNKPHSRIILNFISEMFSPGTVTAVASLCEELHKLINIFMKFYRSWFISSLWANLRETRHTSQA